MHNYFNISPHLNISPLPLICTSKPLNTKIKTYIRHFWLFRIKVHRRIKCVDMVNTNNRNATSPPFYALPSEYLLPKVLIANIANGAHTCIISSAELNSCPLIFFDLSALRMREDNGSVLCNI
jgi:hypothetical protein